jgi:osmotically-inducible protein OsmY
MFGKNEVSDKEILKTVKRKLERTGTASANRLTATVQRGTVTLVGKLQYENQRTPIVKAATGVPGVRHVIDQLQSPPKVNPYSK